MESEVIVEKIKIKISYTPEELDKLKRYLEATAGYSGIIAEAVGDQEVIDFIAGYNQYIEQVMESVVNPK